MLPMWWKWQAAEGDAIFPKNVDRAQGSLAQSPHGAVAVARLPPLMRAAFRALPVLPSARVRREAGRIQEGIRRR
jgi:hypothetical protein